MFKLLFYTITLTIFIGRIAPGSNTFVIQPNFEISAVLAHCSPGDTVIVKEGIYRENLVIDVRVFLKGENQPIIKGNYNGHVILVKASGVIIEGFKVQEAGTRLLDDFACIRIEADSVILRHNIITEPLHGVYVKGGHYATIHDNVINGRLDLIPADRGNGIHLWNSKNNKLYRNEILNTRDGIYFSFADSTHVWENYIHNTRYGLHYMYSDENSFRNNLFENNVAGAALMYSQGIEFFQNVFARCRGFRAYGLLYQSMDKAIARNNLIIDNSRGVFFDNSNNNLFEHNDVVDNDLALQLMGAGEENRIVNNNYINNLSNLIVDSKNSQTVWATEAGGSHWSDYRGYDLDGDGIGDIPHKIQNVFQVMEAKVPEIRFYLNSPAAEILELAERSLPILDLGTESDPAPRIKPFPNEDVPWTRTEELNYVNNPLFAGLYFFVGLLFMFIIYVGKRKTA
jgi:nitrous oxidase accessory protein